MSIKINIPEDVNLILKTLQNNGYEAYIVGGCVRDSILNRSVNDWDITTSARPEEIIKLFEKIIPTGLQHGTVTVMINDEGYEVTTFRKDGEYEDSRHPSKVEYVTSILLDLSRRDFTINSMAYNDAVGLVDPFEGIKDLKNKLIRCVGRAKDRFSEDALRMLRALRFSAQLDFDIDFEITEASKELHESLNKISVERIREEFNKILISNSEKLEIGYVFKLTECWVSELNGLEEFSQDNPNHVYSLFDHTLKSTKLVENTLHLKLTMLLHDLGKVNTKTIDDAGIAHYYGHPNESAKIAEKILKRLKYDNDTIEKVLTLVKYHDSELRSRKSVKKMLNRIGEELLRDLIKVKWADILSQNLVYAKDRLTNLVNVEQKLNEILEAKECFCIKDLAINGSDLINLGVKPGKEIGVLLNILLDKVIEDNSLNNKEFLIEIYKKII
ncbi:MULTISPECIES: CCA tRNA nucleotidyltransferase [Clostridium]|uniref:CCA tRNA nucleotidyltransferase n=1 Tax=Clostridium cibarium TaxID=2762247 RepID=A0ABR8PP70_9CLOT|nr:MULTISPECIES: CCA tRNA nucleotidyltransferase [Clostridium]MBD7909968.1 CCA tRNA nucleotidyltransferase [Clostridium cibarium]